MQILIAKRYKILTKLSSGSFGQIFHAINITTGQQLAIKLQKIDSKYPQLLNQAKIITTLLNNATVTDKGIPNLYYSGQEGDYNAMVMELMGKNLGALQEECGGTFSVKTSLMLFTQLLKRLEYIHSRQFLHRDIKPQNFVMGRLDKKQKVFVIDFGLSKRYIKNNLHIPYSQGRSMVGTVRYASVNTHLGIEPTRRDDLESLVFILYFFLYGRLPWQGLTAPTLSQKYNKILAIKIENKPEVLFKNLPQGMRHEVIEIFRHVRGLKFDEKPNYQFIKGKVREAMGNMGLESDFLFDWAVGVGEERGVGKNKDNKDNSNSKSNVKDHRSSRVMKTVSLAKSRSVMKNVSIVGNTNNYEQKTSARNKKTQEEKDSKFLSSKKGQQKQETLEETLERLKGIKTPGKKK